MSRLPPLRLLPQYLLQQTGVVLQPDNIYRYLRFSGVLSQALIVPADENRQMVLVVWDADAPLARATAVVEQ